MGRVHVTIKKTHIVRFEFNLALLDGNIHYILICGSTKGLCII